MSLKNTCLSPFESLGIGTMCPLPCEAMVLGTMCSSLIEASGLGTLDSLLGNTEQARRNQNTAKRGRTRPIDIKKNHNKNKQERENKEERLDALTYDLTRDLD